MDRYLNMTVTVTRIDSIGDVDDIEASRSYASASVQLTVSVEVEGVWWDGGLSQLENDLLPAWNIGATADVFGQNSPAGREVKIVKMYLDGVKR